MPVIGIKYTQALLRGRQRVPQARVSHRFVQIGVYWCDSGFRNKRDSMNVRSARAARFGKPTRTARFEETLHRFLRLSPYRCARCDRRFMDSKIPASDAPPRLVRRWLSRASRLLHRTPLDEALKRYSIFEHVCRSRPRVPLHERTDRSHEPIAVCGHGSHTVLAKKAACAPETCLQRRRERQAIDPKHIPPNGRGSSAIVLSHPILRPSRATIPPFISHARHRSKFSGNRA